MSKANHLSHLGDAKIGQKANIGAGTITCNYDGIVKFRTTKKMVFIGSNCALVAPVKIGQGVNLLGHHYKRRGQNALGINVHPKAN